MSVVNFDIGGWSPVDVIATFYVAIDAIKGRPQKYGVTWETYKDVEKEVQKILQSKGLPADATTFEVEAIFDADDDDALFGGYSVYIGLKFVGDALDASGYEKRYGEGSAAKAMQILRESGGERRRDGYMAKAFCHVAW